MQHDRNSGKLAPEYLLSGAGGDQNQSFKSSTKMYQLAKIFRIPGLVPNDLCFLDWNLFCIVFCEVSHVSNS